MADSKTPRVKILSNGPYMVTGNVPLRELIIEPQGSGYIYREGRVFPRQDRYLLCRCGKSKHMPFCDGMHAKEHFGGEETASRKPYLERAERIQGPGLDLTDDEKLCAFARFCHSDQGDTWELVRKSGDPALRNAAIKTAGDCPAGRLAAWDKAAGQPFEPQFEPSIAFLQDPERDCSGPIFVRGGIRIESADGHEYEVRNRVTLCRCGRSRNKPFCDAAHITWEFQDGL